MVLSGNSGLAGLDGSFVANADGSDQPLADFTVARPDVGLSDAVAIGAIGATPVAVSGTLDFTANPSAVDLYKITLPAGHFFRLGAEVSAQRDGSPLQSALTLFDAQGNAISTADVGRPDAPNDPFLFAGLKPGTYYVGVSGTGDLPGLPGSYNLQTETPGPQQTQPGGAFTLHLVADAADLPGALLRFSVQHADPLDPTPTGFTLQFSSPLDLGGSGSTVFDRSTSGIDLIDQNGRSWPVAAVNYDAQHAALQYLVRDHLPQGVYTLRMDAQHPLVDLAGISPVSPTMPKGVLANFAVGPDLRQRQANGSLAVPSSVLGDSRMMMMGDSSMMMGDAMEAPSMVTASEDLGPLSPNVVLNGVSRTFTIEPGQTVAFRFVSLYDDFYKFGIHHTGGPVQIDMEGGDDLQCSIDPGPDGQDNSELDELQLGQYLVRFTATGDQPVTVTAKIGIGAFAWDSLLANGLGQGPALNLRLVSSDPPANFSLDNASAASAMTGLPSTMMTGPVAGPFVQAGGSATAAQDHAGSSPAATPGGSVASRGTTGLSIDVGGTLVGRPDADADHVAAVGPGTTSGAIAMASAATGPGQAIAAIGSLRGSFTSSGHVTPRRTPEPTDPGPITDGSMPPATLAQVAPPTEAAPIDAAVELAATEGPTASEMGRAASMATDGALLATAAPQSETEGAQAPAGLAAWVAGLVGMTAAGARWYQKHRRTAPTPASAPAFAVRAIPAPHARRTGVRV